MTISRPPAPPPTPLVVTMGDPAGVGGEILAKVWRRREEGRPGDGPIPPFFVVGDPDWLSSLCPIHLLDDPTQAPSVFSRALPVLPERLANPVRLGQGDPENGAAIIRSIERAVALTAAGVASGVVTLPINKHVLQSAGFAHPGHTEFLGELAARHWADAPHEPVMMLACPRLRVVPVTVHMALRRAVETLSIDRILTVARITEAALRRDFGLAAPRLALAGLNPHAGEEGRMGSEDATLIAPAVATLRDEGIDARGPLPADTLFHAEARERYDVALGMYHDQVLIPIKTLDFHGGVNVTLGLPFIRTSPDHGTAFDIAGRGMAREDSLLASLHLAGSMARTRAESGI
ncbi:MAG: 4-hydroxythreonine-4-phosphate dehydrogenase PdxA [Rhodospirillum sp.]|nr:4-hydroxythreonine-4-phosphate dehydrogenase PdxA [Rhodospirillum sp.]MCF8488645.1 4-hydroxythreonine-4-phosphate dehydrogenase PdxA [Rhodospirillum sp.]MCF8503028.1 4-hydroxythreonine-4-phosphate dehydrogenase PdxA [Rhodospirillum sp.]